MKESFYCPHNVWGRDNGRSVIAHLRVCLDKIRESSEKSCAACFMLLHAIEDFKPGWTTEDIEHKRLRVDYDVHGQDGGPLFSLLENVEDMGSPDEEYNMDVELPHLEEQATRVVSFSLKGLSPAYPTYPEDYSQRSGQLLRLCLDIQENSSSPGAFETVRRWYTDCKETHPFCRIPKSVFKPKRLLGIDLSPGTDMIRLWAPDQPAEYAALSYCWGTDLDGILRASRSNIDSLTSGFSSNALPKTLRDAVTVCRELGIANLWADALCIIQDDQDDWLEQSAAMLEIYGRSALTIYANKLASCKEGFLGPQKLGLPVQRRRLKMQLPKQAEYPKRSRSRGRPPQVCYDGTTDLILIVEDDKCLPTGGRVLEKRGWCLQEDIMPIRKLYYDKNEMSWRCACQALCECGHAIRVREYADNLPMHREKVQLQLATPGSYWYPDRDRKPDPKRSQVNFQQWAILVEEYTLRSLTVNIDKLSAISGLAKMLHDATALEGSPDTYYAGLWKSSFLVGLLWNTVRPKSTAGSIRLKNNDQRVKEYKNRRQAEYRAPSWSWASVDGPVRYDYLDERALWKGEPSKSDCATIEEIQCDPLRAADPTGRIQAGPAYLVARGCLAERKPWDIQDTLDFHGDVPPGRYFDFPLITWWRQRNSIMHIGRIATWGLTLRLVESDGGEEVYERVGVSHYKDSDHYDDDSYHYDNSDHYGENELRTVKII